ncbi:hypothetical protein [Pseudonocardia kujensis]|uniref:hypothetical protein n=1 Tax=Pseudonocardia kujensis TaxID=1128675 RepID=UPI0027DF98EB|nr:hypothetical protein [Pseudonocardia kujensis]
MVAFSIIAGVDARIGLFASFTTAVRVSLVGAGPAMISAATGAEDPAQITIDLSGAHVCGASTVAALDAVTQKYAVWGTR